MLTIRLSRIGKRLKPQYRIVLQEKGRDPWSPAIEILGNYNPQTTPSTIQLKEERIKYWVGQGAQPSETVHNMLVNAGIIKGEKAKSVTISNKRAEKIAAKQAADVEAKKAAEAKKAEAEAAEKAAQEAAAAKAAEEAAARAAETTAPETAPEAAPAQTK